jgi:hypothetical protein
MAFHLARIKRQRQILALGGGEPLGRAHGVLPEVGLTISQLKMALNNLALAATNDPPAAHGDQPGPHDHSHNAHSNQREVGRCGGQIERGGDSSGDSDESGKRDTGHVDPVPQQLLLDTWALLQQTPHQCHLRQ